MANLGWCAGLYLGGRWWVDVNGNGMQDSDDDYFLCPLLGPGREEP